MKIVIDRNGFKTEVSKKQLFALAENGSIGPETKLFLDDRETTAGRISGIVFKTISNSAVPDNPINNPINTRSTDSFQPTPSQYSSFVPETSQPKMAPNNANFQQYFSKQKINASRWTNESVMTNISRMYSVCNEIYGIGRIFFCLGIIASLVMLSFDIYGFYCLYEESENIRSGHLTVSLVTILLHVIAMFVPFLIIYYICKYIAHLGYVVSDISGNIQNNASHKN